MDSTTSDTQAAAPAPATSAAKSAAAPYTLVVKHAFADYQIGQEITDAAEVAVVLAGENTANVLKRAV
ncbi:hypothetical protein [Pseudomonas knackmussii]|uniref:hypothetical protein n=1 Tax=Pseudomonas knackmussii TaxID=65741 RepID=UPI003F4A38BB